MADFQQAVVRTGGKQYRVEPGAVLRVEKLSHEVGASFELDDVLLVGNADDVKIGTPRVDGAKVKATVTKHGRGPKLIVFKYRRRKNYRVRNGHRQAYTEIKVDGITG